MCLLGNRVTQVYLVRVRPQVAPTPIGRVLMQRRDICPHMQGECCAKMKVEVGVRQQKPRNAQNLQWAPEAGRAVWDRFLWKLPEAPTLVNTLISNTQN